MPQPLGDHVFTAGVVEHRAVGLTRGVDAGYRNLIQRNHLLRLLRIRAHIAGAPKCSVIEYLNAIVEDNDPHLLFFMQPAENPEINRTAEIAPAIRNKDLWRMNFVDGTAGEVDRCRFLSNSNIDGTIFEPLRDPAGYSPAQVVRGAILWPSGADLLPDAMSDAIRERGVWVLE